MLMNDFNSGRSRRSNTLRQDDASSPRMLLCDEDSEGTAEEYHNWPEGSHMQLVGGAGWPWALGAGHEFTSMLSTLIARPNFMKF